MTLEPSARQSFQETLATRFAVHRDLRVTRVSGADARDWLNDLVTSDVASLRIGELRPSLLLGPTGRIRAVFAMVAEAHEDGDAFLGLQDASDPSVGALLAPYVLSSRVKIEAVGGVPVSVPESQASGEASRPSLLSVLTLATTWGATEILPPGLADALAATLVARGLSPLDANEIEHLRVLAGVPRFGIDLDDTSIPAEPGWEDRIDTAKGCFLGQESVAKVRNLGHPPRVILSVEAPPGTRPGDPVLLGGEAVGVVTSASDTPSGNSAALVRVRWQAREGGLSTTTGPLRRRG